MEHSYIEDNALVDRYLTRKLGAAERAAFEEHFLDCRQCLDQLKFAESLQSGIRTFAADAAPLTEVPARSAFFGWFAGGWWRLAVPVPAALLIVLLPVSVLLRRYRNEAVRVEVASADLRTKYTALQRQLDQSQRGTAVFILSETRGAQTGATQKIPIPRTPQWIVLAIERDVSQFPSYRATLEQRRPDCLAERSHQSISPDAIGISFPSSLLVPGDYTIELEGLVPGGGPELVGTLSFRAIPNP